MGRAKGGETLREKKRLVSVAPPHCQIEPGAQRALGMKLGWEKHRAELGQGWGLVQIRA